MCSTIGGRSPRGLSSAGSSSSDPGRGRWKARGLARHRSIVRWPHSRDDALIEARSGTQCAQSPDIKVEEIEEARTQCGADSGGE